MVMYGILRFFIEGMRMDSLMWGALRVSQWLSLILVVAGVALIIYIVIKNTKNKRQNGGDRQKYLSLHITKNEVGSDG